MSSARVVNSRAFVRSVSLVMQSSLRRNTVKTISGFGDLRMPHPRVIRPVEHFFPIDVGARTKLEDAMPRNANKLWTDQDEIRLRGLAASGASLVRATAALRRSSSSVKRKALDLGLAFRGVKQVRADLRAAGVLDGA